MKPGTQGGVATVVLAADRHELAVVTTGLPALPPGWYAAALSLRLLAVAEAHWNGPLPDADRGA